LLEVIASFIAQRQRGVPELLEPSPGYATGLRFLVCYGTLFKVSKRINFSKMTK